MEKKFHLVASFLLLLLTLYFYINNVKLHTSYRNSEHIQSRTINIIPTLVAFQRVQDSRIDETQNCTRTFNLSEITVNLHNKWQKVGTDSVWYTYSAYVDNRLGSPLLRILALSKGGGYFGSLFCRTWHNSTNSSVVEARKRELWIHAWDYAKPGQYSQPFLLSCPTLPNPLAVSIVGKSCEPPRNLINITSTTSTASTLNNFVVCLKPLDFKQNVSFRLLEWLELQFLLGVDKVFVYVYNVHPQTWKVLKYYEKVGKVVIKIHGLPEKSIYTNFLMNQTKIKKLWQKRRHEMLIYNDCFYRHIHSHRFVVNLDLDEAIVPVLHDSWFELLKNASATNYKLQNSASLATRNVYFFDSFEKLNDSSVPHYMYMLHHMYRSANFTPPGFAQKSFFNTNLSLTVSNHFALQALRPQVRIISAISEDLVHLHHYRKDCPPLMQEDCENNYMKFYKKDTVLWRYKDNLVRSIQNKMEEIGLEKPPNQ